MISSFKVGILLIISIILFIIFSFYLNPFSDNYKYYYLELNDATGITEKSLIKFAGVPIGIIDKMSLNTKKGVINLKLKIKDDLVLYEDAGVIKRDGSILGDKYLQILAGSSNIILKENGEIKKVSETQGTENLIITLNDVAKDLKIISGNMKNIMGDKKSIDSFKNSIKNLDRITTSLEKIITGNENKLNNVINNADTLFKDLSKLTPQTLYRTIKDGVKKIF